MGSERVMGFELKFCPFCDGDPVLDGRSDSVRVRCLQCGAHGEVIHIEDPEDAASCDEAERKAVEAWNRRP